MRRSLFDALDGYDESFNWLSELDLWLRASTERPVDIYRDLTVLTSPHGPRLSASEAAGQAAVRAEVGRLLGKWRAGRLGRRTRPVDVPCRALLLTEALQRGRLLLVNRLWSEAEEELTKARRMAEAVDGNAEPPTRAARAAAGSSPLEGSSGLLAHERAELAQVVRALPDQADGELRADGRGMWSARRAALGLWSSISGKVSITVPVYNAAAHIAECLASILGQTYTNLEAIVVDDGSQDESIELVEALEDPRVGVIRHDRRRGLPTALNTGLEAADGAFWGWCAADDRLCPDMIATLVFTLQHNPECGVAHGDYEHFGAESRRVVTAGADGRTMYERGIGPGPGFLVRSEMLARIDKPAFDDRLMGIEDTAFKLELSRLTRFVHVPAVVYQFRRHRGQLTQGVLDVGAHLHYLPLYRRMRRRYRERHSPCERELPAAADGSKMRVLFIYRHAYHGGVETALLNRIRGLSWLGVDVEVCFLCDAGGAAMFRDICPVHVLGTSDTITATLEIAELLDRRPYDVVTQVQTPIAYRALELAGFGGGVVAECHGAFDALSDISETNTDALVAVSEYVAAECEARRVPITPTVIPNPVPVSDFSRKRAPSLPLRRQLGLSAEHRIIAWVGRLAEEKDWRTFLAMAQRLVDERRSPLAFWVVGGAEQPVAADEFRHEVDSRGLVRHLHWFPVLEYSQMPALYQAVADSGGILVVTSPTEAFGMVAAEAMAAGVPVVAGAPGACRELLAGRLPGEASGSVAEDDPGACGLLVDRTSPRHFARAVTRLLECEGLYTRLSRNGRRRARRLDTHTIAPLFQDLYRRIVAGRPPCVVVVDPTAEPRSEIRSRSHRICSAFAQRKHEVVCLTADTHDGTMRGAGDASVTFRGLPSLALDEARAWVTGPEQVAAAIRWALRPWAPRLAVSCQPLPAAASCLGILRQLGCSTIWDAPDRVPAETATGGTEVAEADYITHHDAGIAPELAAVRHLEFVPLGDEPRFPGIVSLLSARRGSVAFSGGSQYGPSARKPSGGWIR